MLQRHIEEQTMICFTAGLWMLEHKVRCVLMSQDTRLFND